jgi:galactokinase
MQQEVGEKFKDLYGVRPKIFRAPGRVNLIGEHTDYNEGFVLPCALGFSTRVAISPRPDSRLIVRSSEFPEQFEFYLENLPSHGDGAWCDYVLGVAVMLRQAGYLPLVRTCSFEGKCLWAPGLAPRPRSKLPLHSHF